MMPSRSAIVLSLVLVAAIGRAEESPPIDAALERTSYSLGHQIGSDLRREGREIDLDALERGVREALEGKAPALSQRQMDELLADLKRGIQATQPRRRQEIAGEHRAEGEAFLAANVNKPGVVELESGLQYKVRERGTGKSPGPRDKVVVHYQSSLIDGTVFHESHAGDGKPETLHVSGVIRGLTQALQLMREGERWQLFIPPDLAYGRRGPLADRTVVCEVELISVEVEE
jgi:FKBP-type peptidyl-prolyl cis-trans isomerase FklB